MNAKLKNSLLIAAVAGLTILPLLTVRQSGVTGGKTTEIFRGSDSQAADVVKTLAPEYKPWFQPIIKPPGNGAESLLFALQAAIGAGFIGYYAGYSRGRSRNISTPPDSKREN